MTMPGRGVGPALAHDEVGGEVAGRPVARTASARPGRPRGRGRRGRARSARAGEAWREATDWLDGPSGAAYVARDAPL